MITNYTLNYPAIKTQLNSDSDTEHTLTIEPLMPGFGYTLANSLRRVFLSTIPGFSVTKVVINELTHEYQAIDGVVEDALDVVLNLKKIRARILTDADTATLKLTKKKEGEVTAKDFDKNAEVEIVNEDEYICYLNKGKELNIEIEIERGLGYQPVGSEQLSANTNPKQILVDGTFSPVTSVAVEVGKVRVGDNINYDKINIDFKTDGSVDAKEVVDYALKLTVDLFANIYSGFGAKIDTEKAEKKVEEKPEKTEVNDEEIKLTPKVNKILADHAITTNGQLKEKIEEISELPGIGDKAMEKIKKYISEL